MEKYDLLFSAAFGVDGLRAADAPALILQGSRDDEVSCAGCSLYAHRKELTDSAVTFRVVKNENTMKITDAFLCGMQKENKNECEGFR